MSGIYRSGDYANESKEVKSLSFSQKIIGILVSPSDTFKSIARLPDMKIPLLNFFSVIILTSISFFSIKSHIQISGSDSFINTFNTYMGSVFFSVLIMNTLFVFILWSVIILIFWGITKYVAVKRDYGEMFKVVMHAFIPLIFSRVVLVILPLLGLPSVVISEGMSAVEIEAQLQLLFNSEIWMGFYVFDAIMWFWSGLLIAYAIKEFNKLEFKRSLLVSYTVITVFIVLMFTIRLF
ncbi:MAG: YIP1 family protein [Candidatus Odinarchaeia archaeon]